MKKLKIKLVCYCLNEMNATTVLNRKTDGIACYAYFERLREKKLFLYE